MRKNRTARLLWSCGLVGVAACATDEPADRAGGSTTTRDSAGITIVEFDTAGASLPVWTVSDTPVVAIGAVDGPDEYVLDRVANAHRLRDGRIVVVDAGASSVRFYDSTGVHVRSIGRDGEGPGEFRFVLTSLVGPDDSLFVYDARLRRMSVLDPDATFRRSFALSEASNHSSPRPAAILPDGRIVAQVAETFLGPPPSGSVVVRDSTALVLVGRDGSIDTLGFWPGDDVGITNTGTTTVIGPAMWGRATTFHVVGDEIVVAESGRWQLEFLDPSGERRAIVRSTAGPRPVTEEDVSQYRSRADDPDVPERMRSGIRERPLPELFPAFADVMASDDGDVWVADYRTTRDEGPRSWLVANRDGPIARVYSPSDVVRVFVASRDRIVGLRFDELGAPQVVVLPVRASGE